MDVTTTNALVGAVGLVVGGSAVASTVTALVGRRQRNAQASAMAQQSRAQAAQLAEHVELMRAQREEMRDGLYKQLLDELQEELDRRTRRVAELETRVAELEARVAAHDRQETELRVELAAVTAERDRLMGEIKAKDRELTDLKLMLASATTVSIPVQRQPAQG